MRAGMDVRKFSARCIRDALDKTNDSNLDEDEKKDSHVRNRKVGSQWTLR